jgi:hypothetical protein
MSDILTWLFNTTEDKKHILCTTWAANLCRGSIEWRAEWSGISKYHRNGTESEEKEKLQWSLQNNSNNNSGFSHIYFNDCIHVVLMPSYELVLIFIATFWNTGKVLLLIYKYGNEKIDIIFIINESVYLPVNQAISVSGNFIF